MTTNGLIILNYGFSDTVATSSDQYRLWYTVSWKGHRIIAPYFANLDVLTLNQDSLRLSTIISYDEIIVDNTTDTLYPVSDVISKDISSAWNTNFTASHIVFITYRDIVAKYNRNYKQTFQVVLASDGTSSYVIFNYEDVSFSTVLTGLHQPGVCSRSDIDRNVSSDNMDAGSNVNVSGRYMFRLSERYCPGSSFLSFPNFFMA